jgi:hypothetical protein
VVALEPGLVILTVLKMIPGSPQAAVGLPIASQPSPLWLAMVLAPMSRNRSDRHEGPATLDYGASFTTPHNVDLAVRMKMEGNVHKSHWLLLVVLLGLLAFLAWYAVSVWTATSPMPLYRNVILGGAATLMFVIGCGLVALMFYSQRKGYDDPARSDQAHRK